MVTSHFKVPDKNFLSLLIVPSLIFKQYTVDFFRKGCLHPPDCPGSWQPALMPQLGPRRADSDLNTLLLFCFLVVDPASSGSAVLMT